MMPVLFGVLGSTLIAVTTPPAAPAPVSTLRQLAAALPACFHAPAHSAGSQVTVRFSLDARGAVIGKPMITFSTLTGSPADKRAFVAAALDALARCTPVHVTPDFGAAIAGRPWSVRFIGGGASEAI